MQNVVISDDLIEVAQQAAIWYYTNYKDNNTNNENNRFNIKEKGLKNLSKKSGNTYEVLDSSIFDIEISEDNKAAVGRFEQEQATILAWYLIDAAKDYADSVKDKYWRLEGDAYWQENRERLLNDYSNDEEKAVEHAKLELALSHMNDEMEESPLKIHEETCNNKKTSNGTMVIGPIKIEKQREASYELNTTILINNAQYEFTTNPDSETNTNTYYISNNNGGKLNKTLNEVVGEDFYISIRNNPLQPGNNTIEFSGNYLTNEKTLWVSSTSEEQPIVEVTPKSAELNLSINTEIPLEGKYTIYLVKKDEQGNSLSGAKFKVGDSEAQEVNNNGNLKIAEIDINKNNVNRQDEYVITETKAPDGYFKYDGEIHVKVTKGEATDHKSYVVKNVELLNSSNQQITDGNVELHIDDNDTNTIYVYVKNRKKEFDLALQKYITKIISKEGTEIAGRNAPDVDISKLNKTIDGIKQTTAKYTFDPKKENNPKNVVDGDFVLYTFTVYNEGELAGYVNKITDNIPKGLQFVQKDNDNKYYAYNYDPDSEYTRSELSDLTQNIKNYINSNNALWSIDVNSQTYTYNGVKTRSVTCDVGTYYKEKNNTNQNKLLSAYDGGNELDSLSITLLLRVNASDLTNDLSTLSEEDRIIRNEVAITEAEDEFGNIQDEQNGILIDRDSQTNVWKGKDLNSQGKKVYQDDEDYDHITLQDEPKIHKGVKSVDNQDSGYGADEEQTWVIESDIPRNIEEYTKYNIIDNIDYRLKFSGIENVIVKIGDTELVKDEDHTITYTENPNGVTNKTNSGTLKLVFISNNEMSNKLKANSGDKIKVTFKTKFAKDENGKLLALLGEEVENQAKLQYTNSSGEEKEEKSEDPEVHTGGVTLYKYEKEENSTSTKNALAGAEFTIYSSLEEARAKRNGIQTATSGDDGIVRFTGLSYGGDATDSETNKTEAGIYEYDSSTKNTKYWIVETITPDGYIKNNEPIEVIINSTSYKENKVEIDYKVPNTPITGKYSMILVKEDEDGVQLNSKAQFKINNQIRDVIGKLTIVDNQEINKNNVNVTDVYSIEETEAPDRYSEFEGIITIQVSKKLADDGKSYVVKDTTFTIADENGKPINNDNDARVTLEGNSIYVHVKNYEKDFDLKLMKFISAVNGKATNRRLTVDASKLNTIVNNKKITTANYNVSKEPIEVRTGDYVTYTLRIYNEGELDGYAKEITEDIPEGLKFVTEEDENLTDKDRAAINFNKARSWKIASKDEDEIVKTVSTDYLSRANSENNLIVAYAGDEKEPKYKDVQIMLKVVTDESEVIRNEAAITEDEDKSGNEIDDRDSDTEEWKKEDSEDLYDDDEDYPKYKEDDEDYDNIIVKNADLALTKFIVAVSDDVKIEDGEYLTADKKVGSKENPYLRATRVDTTELKEGTATTAKYIMVKDPLLVPAESYVLYNIRVYNEGQADVYAGEIKDHLPDYLDYVDCEFNKNYGWKVEEENKTITTDYLSAEKGTDNIINAFDKVNDDGKGSGLSYKDVQILCRVSQKAKTNEQIKNVAEVSKYEDKDGNEIDEDIDSTPDNVEEEHEDDDDYEIVLIKTFDLSLIKYVSEVIITEDGKTKTTATNNTGDNKTDIIPKVEVNKKKLDSTIVKFKYKIKITNEGDIEGYAKEITDYVPQGLKFYSEDNQGWIDEGDNVISTKLLENTLLKPGETADVTVTLRWINGSTNLGLKRNNAEISEDYNDDDVPDKDSTPDNKVPEEDDFDYADVLLSISTGISESITKYIVGATIIIIILASGIVLIKKFVLE